jgi:transcriptional regulator with XRE-family HTH domain
MSDLQRLKVAIKFLKQNDFIEKQQDLVDKLGYNKTYLSGLLNGKIELSSKFIESFCSCFSAINRDWLLTGNGEMLKKTQFSEPQTNNEIIPFLIDKIETLNQKIGRLETEIEILKKGDFQK